MNQDKIGRLIAELYRKNDREKPWKLKYFGVGNESLGYNGNMRKQ